MQKPFTELINHHRGIIYKVCNLYCDEAEDRRDLFQEIVLQLWRAYPSFRSEAQQSTWMYRVALNTAITNFRKESRRPEHRSLGEYEFEIPDMDNGAARDENMHTLMRAIDQLNKLEKAIILLYLDEKSYAEIAEIIGITPGNAGVKINRIKNKLEQLIKNEEL